MAKPFKPNKWHAFLLQKGYLVKGKPIPTGAALMTLRKEYYGGKIPTSQEIKKKKAEKFQALIKARHSAIRKKPRKPKKNGKEPKPLKPTYKFTPKKTLDVKLKRAKNAAKKIIKHAVSVQKKKLDAKLKKVDSLIGRKKKALAAAKKSARKNKFQRDVSRLNKKRKDLSLQYAKQHARLLQIAALIQKHKPVQKLEAQKLQAAAASVKVASVKKSVQQVVAASRVVTRGQKAASNAPIATRLRPRNK